VLTEQHQEGVMANRNSSAISWPGSLLALLVLLAFQACDKIDPVSNSGTQGAEAVTLTCEGCHTTRAYLRRLAIDDGSGGGGGGG
jgi:hypothetical protein